MPKKYCNKREELYRAEETSWDEVCLFSLLWYINRSTCISKYLKLYTSCAAYCVAIIA